MNGEKIKLGLLIDQLVCFSKILKTTIVENLSRETFDFDAPQSLQENF